MPSRENQSAVNGIRSHGKIHLISFYAHLKANGSSCSTRARVISFYGNHSCTSDQEVNFVTLLTVDRIQLVCKYKQPKLEFTIVRFNKDFNKKIIIICIFLSILQ